MWIEYLLIAAVVLGGLQALRSGRLLTAALWLAVSSALTATLLYRAGAAEVAVIELSVGAGLVTVLFVFSIAIAGEDAMNGRTLIPPLLTWLLIVTTAVLLGWAVLPSQEVKTAAAELPFAAVLWEQRSLDVLVQIGLIFAGVMGILGLLAEEKADSKAIDSAVTRPAIQWPELQMAASSEPGWGMAEAELDRLPVREKEMA